MLKNETEREYKSLCLRLGATLLIFYVMIICSQECYLFLLSHSPAGWSEKNAFLFTNILYAFLYLASFMLPVAFFRLMSKKHPVEPLRLMPKCPKSTPLLILLIIGVCYAAAFLNSMILNPLISPDTQFETDFNDFSEPYKVVVQFISVAIVPGVCEEFLFRGTILSGLMPYGKTGAVLASALLFGLMHQNPFQMFYTTMAGILLACVYIYTDSIFCGMLAHILNNTQSVFQGALYAQCSEEVANRIIILFDVIILLLTALVLVLLILKSKKRATASAAFRDGVFGKDLPESEGYVRYPIETRRKVKLFFSPTMVIFIAISFLSMALELVVLIVGMPI